MINFYYIDSTGTAYEHSGQEGERDLAKEKVVSTWPLAWGQFHLECQQTEHEVIVVGREGEQAYGPQLLPGGEWLLFTDADTRHAPGKKRFAPRFNCFSHS